MPPELEQALQQIKQHMNNHKVRVRTVDTKHGPKIVVESVHQEWYDPNYFRTILDNLDSEDQDDEQDTGGFSQDELERAAEVLNQGDGDE